MANPEHLKILKQGVKVWNEWREKCPSVEVDLRLEDLGSRSQFFDFGAVELANFLGGINFSGADLRGVNFKGTNLTGTDFTQATFARSQRCRPSNTRQVGEAAARILARGWPAGHPH